MESVTANPNGRLPKTLVVGTYWAKTPGSEEKPANILFFLPKGGVCPRLTGS